MTLHLHRYAEIPAPLSITRELLVAQPPLNATQIGDQWQWHGEQWIMSVRCFDDGRICWTGTHIRDPQRFLLLTLTLHDATITTHVTLHLAAQLGARSEWRWWRRRSATRQIAAMLDQQLAVLQHQAQEHAPAPRTLDQLPDDPHALPQTLEATHPATVAAFRSMDALDSLAAVAQLDRRWQATEAGATPEHVYETVDTLPPTLSNYDLIYAGGGLGLLHAVAMAQRYNRRVLLFDRGEVGCAHREWNISDRELQALIRLGLLTQAELDQIVMRRYRDGVVRYWPDQTGVRPAELHFPNVLNVSLDAAGLLRLMRRKLEAAGGVVLDHRQFERVLVRGAGEIAVEVRSNTGVQECYGAQVLLDGMGATSPLALRRFAGQPFAGVCPTVGTVVSGLEAGTQPNQHNPEVGDVLISVADAQRGRQLIWEGFAGRGDELTVYLFYYDLLAQHQSLTADAHSSSHSLLDLFEDYFRLLPTYKRPGPDFRHVKPVYGFIPARHTQRRETVPLLTGVLPVGDSSAQQSPLTFCGFGSHVRNLDRTTRLLDYALRHNLLGSEHLGLITAYQSNVALNWVFSRFMQPWNGPASVNRLQNIFARVMNEVGIDVAVRFFQDQMTWRDYGRIVNHTLTIYKPIIPTALAVLGPANTARWVIDWLRFSRSAAVASVGRALGRQRLDMLTGWLDQRSPHWAFRLRALRAEWQAMGWDRRQPEKRTPAAALRPHDVQP